MTTWRNYMKANKTIKIEVYGGCVTEVTNLPEGYDYEIVDHDQTEELVIFEKLVKRKKQ